MEMLNNLEPLLKTFWYVAIPVSLIFVIQSIMSLVGAHAGESMDTDFAPHTDGDTEHDGFHFFSFRNLINFLLGFSWSGISFYQLISNQFALIGIALLVGAIFVWVFFFIITQLQRLAEDNSFQLIDTLYKEVEVYLKIPSKRKGMGKILVSVKGSIHELEAMTEEEEIPSGAKAKVVAIENNKLIIVKPL
ncbi:MAG: serine protease [Bacteroidetes bacterium]|nr:serine protease [Bacteroidota bacterium]